MSNAGYGGIEGNGGAQGQDGTIIFYPGSGNPSSNISTLGYLYLGGGAAGGRGGQGGKGSGSSGGTMCDDGLQGTTGGKGGIGGNGGAGGGIITFVAYTVVKNSLDETRSTVFDLRGENGGNGYQGTNGNDGPDGVCGGGGGRGAKGGAGGNPGGGGAGGKGYFSIFSGMPSLDKILLSGGGVGEKGTSSPSGANGARGIITPECSCGIPIPPEPVSCNSCSMKKALDLISATNTFVTPNTFSNDTISCILSKVYDCDAEVDLLQCQCIEIKSSNDTCYINGFIQDGAEDIILHLAQKDPTITYDNNRVSSINDGSFDFLSCELEICEDDNDGDSYEVLAGEDGSVEFHIPTLPITLRELSGYCENGIPIIEWKTESEFNNDYYSIYKSKDGLQKELIARVDGMGTKISPTEYLWEDNSKTDEPYYHLQQTDIDGKSYWLGTIYIQCNNKPQGDIKVYFNNLSKEIIISNLISGYPTTWELYNVLGSQLRNGKINQAQGENIYLNDIIVPKGIYFLQMKNQKMQKSFTLKID
ncbi:MAG: T9SS type A sorting domain-containing protein [Chitinophagales bacterium]|nr:T9SS type A sorting domain-containing protein [Chitinophagales bacterium]